MAVIVDYGMGNIGSIANMLRKIGAETVISSSPEKILTADRLILPGVGAFDNGMKNLHKLGLTFPLNEAVLVKKIPVLGICLGMQLLSRKSEEGMEPGLGWIDAETVRFNFKTETKLKVPHMGWNTVEVKKQSGLFREMHDDPRFYFVHSYHVVCFCPEDILSTTQYGICFNSSVEHENIAGVQFHPEKSHTFGMKLLKNFIKAAG